MATQAELAVLRGTATQVKNESQVGGNTAQRVGGLFEGIVDALPSDEAIDGKISEAVNDIQPIVIEGNVDNAPDQEDLTSVNQGGTDVLKFKDKTYSPALFSGLGRVYLRKNVVTPENLGYAVNLLTAEMVAQPNTIYRIQYNYDLNGATITLPTGCVLEFDGGSIKNGTLVGNNANVVAEATKIFDDVHFVGTWQIHDILPEWFGAIGYGLEVLNTTGTSWIYAQDVEDSTEAIRSAVAMMFETRCTSIYLGKLYVISDEIQINTYENFGSKYGFEIHGNGYGSGFYVSFSDATKYALSINSTTTGIGVRNNVHDVAFYVIRPNLNTGEYNLKGILSVREVIRSRFENILIHGGYNVTATDGLFCFYGLEDNNFFGIDIVNCSGFNATANGIYFGSATYAPAIIDVSRCKFQQLNGIAIYQPPTMTNTATGFSGRIVGCELEGCTKGAIFMGAVNNLIVESNYFELDSLNNLQQVNEYIPACPWVFGVFDIISTGWKSYVGNLTFRNNHCGSSSSTLKYAIICCSSRVGSYTQKVFIENNELGSANDKYEYLTCTGCQNTTSVTLEISNNNFVQQSGMTNFYDGLPIDFKTKNTRCRYTYRARTILYDRGYISEQYDGGELGEIQTDLTNNTIFPVNPSTSWMTPIKQNSIMLYKGRLFVAKNDGKLNLPVEGEFTQGSAVVYHSTNNWTYTSTNGFEVGKTIYTELVSGGTATITAIDATAKTITLSKNALRTGKALLRTVGMVSIDRDCAYVGTRPTDAVRMRNDLNHVGSQMFDTTLGKPIWWDGSQWVDATGTAV